MNSIERIILEHDTAETDVLIELMNVYYKEYTMLNEYGIVYQEEETTSDTSQEETESPKKKKLGTKIIEGLTKIWKAISSWAGQIVKGIRNLKTKKAVQTVNDLTDDDLTKMEDALNEMRSNDKPKPTQEAFSPSTKKRESFQNIDQIDNVISDTSQAKTYFRNGLLAGSVGHAINVSGGFALNPVGMLTLYNGYLLAMLLSGIIKVHKLKKTKHDLFGTMPELGKVKFAFRNINQIFNNLLKKKDYLTNARTLQKMDIDPINTKREEQVLKQIKYFYDTDIRKKKLFFGREVKNEKTCSTKDVETFTICMNFVSACDKELEDILSDTHQTAKQLSSLLNKNFGAYADKHQLIQDMLRLSKDTLEVIADIYVVQKIGSDTTMTLANLHNNVKNKSTKRM